MLKVTLKNGNEYELLEDTTVYPSGSPNARSRMEIHMGEDAYTYMFFRFISGCYTHQKIPLSFAYNNIFIIIAQKEVFVDNSYALILS